MKKLFKLGCIAFALSLSLASCDFFGKTPKTPSIDSNQIDSGTIDSTKLDSQKTDSTKIKPDSAALKR